MKPEAIVQWASRHAPHRFALPREDTPPPEDLPVVCILARAAGDRRVRLLSPVLVSHRAELVPVEPGEELRCASWQAASLIRDGFAVAL